MKTWMIAIIAVVAGIGLWLYSRRERKAVAVVTAEGVAAIADVEALIQARPAGVTVAETMREITTALVQPGLEEFGVDVNRAVDVVARQATMLKSDISALARREMEGQDITQQLLEEAETYRIDAATLRDMVDVSLTQKSSLYMQYAAEKAAGTYMKPWSTYQAEAMATSKAEAESQVDLFHDTRMSGETFTQWQRRMSTETALAEPTAEFTRAVTGATRTPTPTRAPAPAPAPAPRVIGPVLWG